MEHDPQLCAGVYLAMQGKSGWRRQTINVSEGGLCFILFRIVDPRMGWHSLVVVIAQFQSSRVTVLCLSHALNAGFT